MFSGDAEARQWADATGNFHTKATFRGLAKGIVKLERDNGSVINVPLEKLSEDDQAYIRNRSK